MVTVTAFSEQLIEEIKSQSELGSYRFMEVCGTHTMAISRFGLRKILPQSIELLSGPGCPVCVTDNSYIDQAISYAKKPDIIVATFGDMMRVPGSHSSLEKERALGRDIRVIYSPRQALDMAISNPKKKIIFLAVGFETTAPTTAATIIEAYQKKIGNFLIFSGHKTIPPALKALSKGSLKIDSFILPGHVSAIIGSRAYDFLAENSSIGGVVAGFEAFDILEAILMLLEQKNSQRPVIEIQYSRVVSKQGNQQALKVLNKVFELSDSIWRGIGIIPDSGLVLRQKYRSFDVKAVLGEDKLKAENVKNNGCLCGLVLQGLKKPQECKLFAKACLPEHPVGPCMVSSEGTCAAYYKYLDRGQSPSVQFWRE